MYYNIYPSVVYPITAHLHSPWTLAQNDSGLLSCSGNPKKTRCSAYSTMRLRLEQELSFLTT